jgi:hypothetical protein
VTDNEVLNKVRELSPPPRNPPPRPHPSMNMGGFMNGRGVYEVEEELLALYAQLSQRKWKRIFQWQRWKLWLRWHQYYPMSVKTILADRRAYLESLQ